MWLRASTIVLCNNLYIYRILVRARNIILHIQESVQDNYKSGADNCKMFTPVGGFVLFRSYLPEGTVSTSKMLPLSLLFL